jgi:hypothetical protein
VAGDDALPAVSAPLVHLGFSLEGLRFSQIYVSLGVCPSGTLSLVLSLFLSLSLSLSRALSLSFALALSLSL